jgi:hypothetical protein
LFFIQTQLIKTVKNPIYFEVNSSDEELTSNEENSWELQVEDGLLPISNTFSDQQEINIQSCNVLLKIKQLNKNESCDVFLIQLGTIFDQYSLFLNNIESKHSWSEGVIYSKLPNKVFSTLNNCLDESLKKDFNIIGITGNGNCLFNAISYLLHGTEKYSADLRLLAIYAIYNDLEIFNTLIQIHAIDIQNSDNFKLQTLIKSIATNYEWGNEGALMALSIALKRKIISVNQLADSKSKNFTNGYAPIFLRHLRPICLLLTDPGGGAAHYSAMCPKTQTITNYQFDIMNLADYMEIL